MSENPYNPNDPAFLASRSIDEPLIEQDKRRLTDAVANTDDSRLEVDAFRRIDQVVKLWGADQVSVDADRFTHQVMARIADESDQTHHDVDQIVHRWAQAIPDVDENQYVDTVLARIRTEQRGLHIRPLIFRIGLPLAAAAAVALALTAGLWFGQDRAVEAPVSMVTYAPREHASDREVAMTAAPRTSRVVVFERTAVVSAARADNGRAVSFMVVGSSPIEGDMIEPPPL